MNTELICLIVVVWCLLSCMAACLATMSARSKCGDKLDLNGTDKCNVDAKATMKQQMQAVGCVAWALCLLSVAVAVMQPQGRGAMF